jgi:hypothetical protein
VSLSISVNIFLGKSFFWRSGKTHLN